MRPPWDRGRAAGLAACAAVFYLATMHWNLSIDGMAWAILLELQAQRGALHFEGPHYLLYFLLTQTGYMILRNTAGLLALPFLSLFSAAASGAALALFDRILARAGRGPFARAAGILALGLAPPFWTFASVSEVYQLGFVCLFAGILAGTGGFAARVAGFLLPVLGHQSLATFGVAQLIEIRRADGRWRGAITAGTAGVALFTALAFAAWCASPDVPSPFARWFLGHARPESGRAAAVYWGSLSSAARAAATRPALECSVWLGAGWAIAIAGFAGLVRAARAGGEPDARRLLAFAPPAAAFFLAWDPQGNDFWLFLLAPAAYGLAALADRSRWAGAAVVAMLLANAVGTYRERIAPFQDPDSNDSLLRARIVKRDAGINDRILLPDRGASNADKVFLPYFTGRVTILADRTLGEIPVATPPEEKLLHLDGHIERVRAATPPDGRILAVREIFEDSAVREGFASKYGIPPDSWTAYANAHRGETVGTLLRAWRRAPAPTRGGSR